MKNLKLYFYCVCMLSLSIISCKSSYLTSQKSDSFDSIEDEQDIMYYSLPATTFKITYTVVIEKEQSDGIVKNVNYKNVAVERLYTCDKKSVFKLNVHNYKPASNYIDYDLSLNNNQSINKIIVNTKSNTIDNLKTIGIGVMTLLNTSIKALTNIKRLNTETFTDTIAKVVYFTPSLESTSFSNEELSIAFVPNEVIVNPEINKNKEYKGIFYRVPQSGILKMEFNMVDTTKLKVEQSVNVSQFGSLQLLKVNHDKFDDRTTTIEFYDDGTLKNKILKTDSKSNSKLTRDDFAKMNEQYQNLIQLLQKKGANTNSNSEGE